MFNNQILKAMKMNQTLEDDQFKIIVDVCKSMYWADNTLIDLWNRWNYLLEDLHKMGVINNEQWLYLSSLEY